MTDSTQPFLNVFGTSVSAGVNQGIQEPVLSLYRSGENVGGAIGHPQDESLRCPWSFSKVQDGYRE